jgi:hypothetical protein
MDYVIDYVAIDAIIHPLPFERAMIFHGKLVSHI